MAAIHCSKEVRYENMRVTGAGARPWSAMALYLGDRGYDVAVHDNSSSVAVMTVVAGAESQRPTRRWPCRLNLLDEKRPRRAAASPLAGTRCLGTDYLPWNKRVDAFEIYEQYLRPRPRKSWARHIGSQSALRPLVPDPSHGPPQH